MPDYATVSTCRYTKQYISAAKWVITEFVRIHWWFAFRSQSDFTPLVLGKGEGKGRVAVESKCIKYEYGEGKG